MADEGEGVKPEVKPDPPAGGSEEESGSSGTGEEGTVTEGEETSAGKGAETKPKPEDDLEAPVIPRHRLNEEIEKRKSAEEQAKLYQSQLQMFSSLKDGKENEKFLEKEAEEYAQRLGCDIETAKKLLMRQEDIARRAVAERIMQSESQTSSFIAKSNITELFNDNPDLKKYQGDVEKIVLGLTPDLRIRKDTAEVVFRQVVGGNYKELLKLAEQKGKKQSAEQKKIVEGVSGEGAGHTPPATPKGKLSDAEKKIAGKMGMSEGDYAEWKSKRIVR